MRAAELIWDGTEQVRIPTACGEPRADQMIGTTAERLAELAGRECYDSLGRGRDSAAFHAHVLEVGHTSIHEHFNFTVSMRRSGLGSWSDLAAHFLNRPGCWIERADCSSIRVTMNVRSLLDWERWAVDLEEIDGSHSIYWLLCWFANYAFPQVLNFAAPKPAKAHQFLMTQVEPESREEKWVTMRLVGSRGFSHELVRHKFRTAVSQRSTRYVDESESPWCHHPLAEAYEVAHHGEHVFESTRELVADARAEYADWVERLEFWLTENGVDKTTARKQARGAARGYLGNALQTSLIFSASVAQWRRMIALRCAGPADAEIREVFCDAVDVLKACRYADEFEDVHLVDSPDGIGRVAIFQHAEVQS